LFAPSQILGAVAGYVEVNGNTTPQTKKANQMKRVIAALALGVAALAADAAQAAEIEVLMLNKGAGGAMGFEPDLGSRLITSS
jgi:hypothetical protein